MLVDKGHVRDGGCPRKRQICAEDKAQCEQLHCIGQDIFLAPTPVPTITQTQAESPNKAKIFLFWSPVQPFARKSEWTVSLDGRGGGGDGLVPELFLMSSFLSQRAVALSTLLDGWEGPQQLVMY